MFNAKKIAAAALTAAAHTKHRVVIKLKAKSDHVHLNDEAPFSFKVSVPNNSKLESDPKFNLNDSQAAFEFTYGGVPGDLIVNSRLFYCADSGQCVSESVDFTIPVQDGASAGDYVVEYEYDVETKKKWTVL